MADEKDKVVVDKVDNNEKLVEEMSSLKKAMQSLASLFKKKDDDSNVDDGKLDDKEKDVDEGKPDDTEENVDDKPDDTEDKSLDVERIVEKKLNEEKLAVMLKDIPVGSKTLLDKLLKGIDDPALKIEKINDFKGALGSVEKAGGSVGKRKKIDTIEIPNDILEVVEELGYTKEWAVKMVERNRNMTDADRMKAKKVYLDTLLSGDSNKVKQYLENRKKL